jgi:hypothetical protein
MLQALLTQSILLASVCSSGAPLAQLWRKTDADESHPFQPRKNLNRLAMTKHRRLKIAALIWLILQNRLAFDAMLGQTSGLILLARKIG